jgi:hypothetical protein
MSSKKQHGSEKSKIVKHESVKKVKSEIKSDKPPTKSAKKTLNNTEKMTNPETSEKTNKKAPKDRRRSSRKKTQRTQFTRFYDDSPDNIADVITHGDIECIHVPRVNSSRKKYIKFVKENGGWDLNGEDSDLKQVLDTMSQEIDEEWSDSLTSQHMNELRTFVNSKPIGSCRVMFDFDRVINQVEGTISGKISEITSQGLNVSGLAKYHIGTKARLQDFRRTIDELVKRKCKVSVVTNNPGCKDESFIAVLHYIHPHFQEKNVHCSFRFANKLNCMSARKLLKT